MVSNTLKDDDIFIGKMPDFSRPVIFLDFDGVVSPVDYERAYKNRENRKFVSDKDLLKGRNLIVPWSPLPFYMDVIEFLREQNCLWITSWQDATQDVLNPLLGFDFGYIKTKNIHGRRFVNKNIAYKLEAVAQTVERFGCDWILVDDDARYKKDPLESVGLRSGFYIAPDSYKGLSEDECKKIKDYIDEITNK